MLKRSEIELAYQLLLGRIPKDRSVIDRLASKLDSIESLRRRFLNMKEVQKRFGQAGGPAATALQKGPGRQLLLAERPTIDYDVPPEQLERLIAHVEGVWRSLGQSEPHWSVLTNDMYKPDSLADNKARFYESGRRQVELFSHAAARNGIDLGSLGTCLEIGSGVGRVTVWLATVFDQVIGCDISAPHLALAEEAAGERNCSNIKFRHVASISAYTELPEFDAFFSVISLQHSPPPVQKHVLEAVLGRLRPGGVGYFQIPTQILGYRFTVDEYLGDIGAHEKMEMHCLPQMALFEIFERTGCRVLEVRDDGHSRPAKLSNTFLVRKRAPQRATRGRQPRPIGSTLPGSAGSPA